MFHAGTRTGEAGEVVTAGGRVLGVTALGRSIEQARSRAYGSVARIGWPGMQHRTDIAAAAGRSGHLPASPDPRPTQEVSG